MKLALLGNQNSGKTSLFNALTGSNQKVGNWPGVTIDRVEGEIKKHRSTIVDLPGVYSLSPYTSEEEVTRQFVLNDTPDLIINIVDSTSLERSLYLTTQILELNCDVVIALNMYDLLLKKGIKIDIDKLSKELGVTIVPISAKTHKGIDKLEDIIFSHKYLKNKHKKIYPDDIEEFISDVCLMHKKPNKKNYHPRFGAVKILEEDRDYKILMSSKIQKEHEAIEKKYGMDGEQLVASLRYDYIEKIRGECVTYPEVKETLSDKLDNIFLHKFWAIPIFILIMGIVYFVSISVVGGLTSNLIQTAFNGGSSFEINIGPASWTIPFSIEGLGPLIAKGLSNMGASSWALSLVENGVVSGVATVVSFIPQLLALFFFLGILETSGYMSRIAFFLDRIFHKLGLSGKSLIPFIVGAGCTVPGIMTTRTIEDENEKRTTIALVPFVPCNAKLTIISLISAAFFKRWGFLIALSFYVFAIVIIIFSAFLAKKIFKHKEHSTFISELPEYKVPNPRYIARDMSDKTIAFIKRAGTVVVFFSVVVWILSSFTPTFNYVDNKLYFIDQSQLAYLGRGFSWFFYLMLGGNMSWAASVSAIQGLIAKEQVISSMQVIANMSNGGVPIDIFASSVFSFFNPITAYAFAAFNLFSIPCVGSIAAMRHELKSVRKTLIVIAYEIVFAWLIASLIGVWGILLK